MRKATFSTGQRPLGPPDARVPQRRQSKARSPPVLLRPTACQPRSAANDAHSSRTRAQALGPALRWGFSTTSAVPHRQGHPALRPLPPARSGPSGARLGFPARRRYGDGHETPAAPAPANGSARYGETRASLFQDGGASVWSSRAGGKPAKPGKAAARERTAGAVAAVGGGSGSFCCCYGCCHAARLERSSLPRGVIMLTEVSGDGGQCLPVKWGRGRRQPVGALHFPCRRPQFSAAGPGPEEQQGSYKCPLNRSCADSTEPHDLQLPVPFLSRLPLACRPWHCFPSCCRYRLTHRSLRGVPLRAALWRRWYPLCCWFLLPYGLLVIFLLRSLAFRPLRFQARSAPWVCHSATAVCFPPLTLTTS